MFSGYGQLTTKASFRSQKDYLRGLVAYEMLMDVKTKTLIAATLALGLGAVPVQGGGPSNTIKLPVCIKTPKGNYVYQDQCEKCHQTAYAIFTAANARDNGVPVANVKSMLLKEGFDGAGADNNINLIYGRGASHTPEWLADNYEMQQCGELDRTYGGMFLPE